MKKILVLFILLLGFSTYSIAQNYTEVVHLKNGNIIKGVIVEQVPNVSLKIKTADGSLFVYSLSEVEKITKEEIVRTKDYRVTARNTLKGYKGFVDAGYIFDTSDNNASKFSISTSHGYQFNNYLFLGAGMAIDCYTDADESKFGVPIFANFRANFINKKITPFADLKSGYSIGDINGTYVALGLGVRFTLQNKMALNLRMEYNYLQHQLGDYNGYYVYDDYMDIDGIGFKIGLEF